MSRPAGIYRRFIASTRGLAAIEFAMVLPVLVVLFLASVDAGRAIAIYMKVRAATYALDAITNQYTTIQSIDMQSILGATSVILAPYSSSPVVVTISQIAISSKGAATVSWSATLNGTALTRGNSVSGVPSGFATASSYIIYGQVSYTYTPLFGYFSSSPIKLSDSLYVTPRSSNCIVYTVVSSSC
jgi:Flp pilus assembly protein TadG